MEDVLTKEEKKAKRNERDRLRRQRAKEEQQTVAEPKLVEPEINQGEIEVEKEKEIEEPKKLPIEEYFARYAECGYYYDAVDPITGQPKVQRDKKGNNVYDDQGNDVIIQKFGKFRTLNSKLNSFKSVATFDPNTTDKQELERGKRLRELAAETGDSKIWSRDEDQRRTNLEAYNERQKTKALENQVEELQKRIAEAEGK